MIYVDVIYEKGVKAVEFFKDFRKRYIKEFNQEEVYIVYHEVTKIE